MKLLIYGIFILRPYIIESEDDFFKDSKITRELNKRMNHGNSNYIISQMIKKISPRAIKEEVEYWSYTQDVPDQSESRRHALEAWKYPNDPQNHTMIYKIMDLMQQSIYTTQKRVDVFQKILSKYEKHPGFLFGVYFSALEKWLKEFHVAYTWVRKQKVTFWVNIIYHTHFAKKNVDVTYTVEQAILLYNNVEAEKSGNKTTASNTAAARNY